MDRTSRTTRFAASMAIAVLAGSTSVAAPAPGSQVQTAEGAVAGDWRPGYRLFEGIPYAEPPVGKLRWRPPQSPRPWAGVRDARRPGDECVQQAIFWRPGSTASWHEDCLYLNVYAPPGETGAKRPVLVWFHGGGWVNGAGIDVQPAWLVAEGNIVVTVNYRLGALGYLASPALDAESDDKQSSGQYGDLDKLEALRWVKRNIAAFGGDPDRVTIAGQSAGAGSVCWLMASPRAKGLFHRAVIQSVGDCLNISHQEATQRGDGFVQAIGCSGAGDVAECLRSKSPAQIIDAQVAAGVAWRPVQGGAAQPTLAPEALAAGDFNRVPVIIGNTRQEARAFVYEGNDLVRQPVTAASFEAAVRNQFGDNADRVLETYPLASRGRHARGRPDQLGIRLQRGADCHGARQVDPNLRLRVRRRDLSVPAVHGRAAFVSDRRRPYLGCPLCLAERDRRAAHTAPAGVGPRHAGLLVELRGRRRSEWIRLAQLAALRWSAGPPDRVPPGRPNR